MGHDDCPDCIDIIAFRLSETIIDLVILLLFIQVMSLIIAVISAVYIDSLLGSLSNNMLLGLFKFLNSANAYHTLLVFGFFNPSL